MKTSTISKSDIKRDWHHYDLKDQVLGKVATEIATKLVGKHKVDYVPYLNCGDCIVVTNAEKVVLTGNKDANKVYYTHSGYVGNLKSKTAGQIRKDNPKRLIFEAVKGMLPKNKLRDERLANLHIYAGEEHPHQAQIAENK